ncbi:MAG: flagellar cap protein [Gammaproteobacteria bacterium]|nr:MAG: flagellar cap protein [Gammaproteobacteria bacterium]RLA19885.1 MAG: flagellar cap protein [Gammaproteobacteria bacterium]
MATIQAPGIGSGLDVNNIVSQLMAIERQPLNALNRKQSFIEAQISAYGQLKSKVSSFQTAMSELGSLSKFQVFAPESSDENVLTATAGNTAVAGSYNINVTALAEKHKLASAAYADINSTVVGEGALTLSVGTDSFAVTIDGTNNTLSGIRDAVNSASDNTGVTATIITDNAGSRLIFSSDDEGTTNALTLTVSGDSVGTDTDASGLSALAYDVGGGVTNLSQVTAAVDATLTIDGFAVTSTSNTIAGAIEGVTVNLEKVGSSSLNIARDDEKIKEAVNAFADAFNDLRDEIDTQRSGHLEADSTLLSMENQLLSVLSSGAGVTGSNFSYLVEVGVSLDKEGKLKVDDTDLAAALDTDFNSFTALFSAAGEGFAARFETVADGFLAANGLIDAREDGLKVRSDRIDDDKFRLELRLELIETRIRAKFTALDALVSNLSSTGAFLTQQLSLLNNSNK